jgi:tryptophan-rich hypothetical protein
VVDTPTPAILLFQFSFDKVISVKLNAWAMTMLSPTRNQINPQKLLLSKWTAVNPQAKEKHFLVTKVIDPEQPKHLIELVELEAVLTNRRFAMRWAELTDATKWRQGWQ